MTVMQEDEIVACTSIAHIHKRRVIAHARTAEAVKRCVKHGIDLIYHANFCDEEALDLLEANKDRFFVNPAIGLTYTTLYEMADYGMPQEKAEEWGFKRELDGAIAGTKELHRRGVRVLPFATTASSGTRWAATPATWSSGRAHGLLGDRPVTMATRYGGECFGDAVGLVAEGYLADLIMVTAIRSRDVRILQDTDRIVMIMKDAPSTRNRVPASASRRRPSRRRGHPPHPSARQTPVLIEAGVAFISRPLRPSRAAMWRRRRAREMSETKSSKKASKARTEAAPKVESKSESAGADTKAKDDKASTPAATSDAKSSDTGKDSGKDTGKEAGKSARDSAGGKADVHYGYFSSVRTPEYRSGWDAIWGSRNGDDAENGEETPRQRGAARASRTAKKARKRRDPVTVTLDLDTLPPALKDGLVEIASAELKKSRVSYARRDKAGAIDWRITCRAD